MNLRSGDVTIVGTEKETLRVSCDVQHGYPGAVKITFAANRLTIRGGTHNDVHYRIEVPRRTSPIPTKPVPWGRFEEVLKGMGLE